MLRAVVSSQDLGAEGGGFLSTGICGPTWFQAVKEEMLVFSKDVNTWVGTYP